MLAWLAWCGPWEGGGAGRQQVPLATQIDGVREFTHPLSIANDGSHAAEYSLQEKELATRWISLRFFIPAVGLEHWPNFVREGAVMLLFMGGCEQQRSRCTFFAVIWPVDHR